MKNPKLKQYLKYIILNVIIAAVISVLLITYVASAYKIEGNSMQTVLKDQDRIIISKIGVRGSLKRFDIVVLHRPDNPEKSIIKRVVGLPEEIIEIRKGDVYINNQLLKETFLSKDKSIMYRTINMRPLLIQKDYYFVMGDNRPFSQDSRFFGAVPVKLIYGKPILRYWPFSRFGSIE